MMFAANIITMTVTPATAGAKNSTVQQIFGSEIEAKTWLGGMLSRELSAKMDFCDKMAAAIERLSVDFKGENGL